LVLQALDPQLLLHVACATAARAVGRALFARLDRSGGDELLGVRLREHVALAHGGHQLGEPARLEHPGAAADLAPGPLREPHTARPALEPDVVAVAALVLVRTGGGVRAGDDAADRGRRAGAALAARTLPWWARPDGRLARIEHGALGADRAVGREAIVAAEEA